MRGIVKIDDGTAVHVIPRSEVRHVEIVALGGDSCALNYQLEVVIRSIEWKGDCRPESLKTKITVGEYNKSAAGSVMTMLTCGHRNLHLVRRSDGVILVRSGLLEEDHRMTLCRKFIADAVTVALDSPHGRLDEAHGKLLREIYAAARDLRLPDEYPIQPIQEDL